MVLYFTVIETVASAGAGQGCFTCPKCRKNWTPARYWVNSATAIYSAAAGPKDELYKTYITCNENKKLFHDVKGHTYSTF